MLSLFWVVVFRNICLDKVVLCRRMLLRRSRYNRRLSFWCSNSVVSQSTLPLLLMRYYDVLVLLVSMHSEQLIGLSLLLVLFSVDILDLR